MDEQTSLPASLQRRASAQLLSQTRPDPSLTHVLDIEGVTIQIRDKTILDDVSFWIPKGEFVCLCGPNGAGKSTLLKAIMGLITPTRGTIRIGGQDVVAAITRGPVLLTPADGLPDSVIAELQRLRPERIVILGGTATIGTGVAATLEGLY